MTFLQATARILLITATFPLFGASAATDVALALPSHDDVVRLVVVGDAGGSHSQLRAGILAVQQVRPIDAIVLVGDNFYPCGVTSVSDPQWSKITEHFGPAHVPIFAILGNHDYGDAGHDRRKTPACSNFASNPRAQIAATGNVPEWNAPSDKFVVRNGLADLILLDTQPIAMGWDLPFLGSGTSSTNRAWLAGKLRESQAPWKIVIGHHTIFSSGVHGQRNDSSQRNMRTLLPLFRKEHVDLYVCGHDHDLELLGDPARHGEPLYLVSGAGSGLDEMKSRKPKALQTEPPTIWPSPMTSLYGFALVEITRTELGITFFDENGVAKSSRTVSKK